MSKSRKGDTPMGTGVFCVLPTSDILRRIANKHCNDVPPKKTDAKKKKEHFSILQGHNRKTTLKDIRDIRKARASGEKKRHVLARFPQCTTGNFDAIWNGTTAAFISEFTTDEELETLEKIN